MVTGRQKKRLIVSSSGSYSIQGHRRAKKKKELESSNNLLNFRAHILLEWDDNQQKVVARKEQIGMTWRDLGPFVSPFSHNKKGLADVISIPAEIFGLEDMSGVLSYEVWASYLSETEKSFLTQFLPKESDVKYVVQSLLSGANLHFGNPLLNWGASLCSGNLHPDVVLHQDQRFNANKSVFYLDLQKRHNEMLKNWREWKERWESCEHCEDPGNNFIYKIWRKGSWDRHMDPLDISDRRITPSSARNEEKVPKLYCCFGDSSKYMSYIKITRKQHQLVKGMKQSSDGIKSKSLNRVLGDMKSYHVQPYEEYGEEGCEKVQEHWTKLANGDIPSAFANWTERQLKRHQLRREFDMEISHKVTSVNEDEKRGNPDGSIQEHSLIGEIYDNQEANADMEHCVQEDKTGSYDLKSQDAEHISSPDDHSELELINKETEKGCEDILKPDGTLLLIPKFLPSGSNMADAVDGEVLSLSAKNPDLHPIDGHPQRILSMKGHCELHEMDVELGDGEPPVISGFVGDVNQDAVEREALVSSAKDGEIGSTLIYMPDSFPHPTSVIRRFTTATASELSLTKSQTFAGRPSCLETGILNQEDRGALLHSSHDLPSTWNGSFFGSFSNQDQCKIPQPFVRSQAMLPFNIQGHKQGRIQIPAMGNGLVESVNPVHLREQNQMLLEQGQLMRERELYMHSITNRSMDFGGTRYLNQSQGHLSSVNAQTWTTNLPHVSFCNQTHSNARELVQNCFPAENRAHSGWAGVDVASTSGQFSANGSVGDGSLYSVLSQSSKLQPQSYSFMGSDQMSGSARNFVGIGYSGDHEVIGGPSQQLNYLRGREASGLNDPTARAFLRSWNQ